MALQPKAPHMLVAPKKAAFYTRWYIAFLRWLFSVATGSTPESYRQIGAVTVTRAVDTALADLHADKLARAESEEATVVPEPTQMTVSSLINDYKSYIKAKRDAAAERNKTAESILSEAERIRRAAIAAANETFGAEQQVANGIVSEATVLNGEAIEASIALEQILGNV